MRRHEGALAIGAGAGAALLVLLGTLQARWLDQVAQTITAQRRAALYRQGMAVATDLERELTRAFFWFQVDDGDEDGAREARGHRLLQRWSSWQRAGRHPELLAAVWLIEPGDAERETRLQRLAPQGGLQEATWPAALAEFRGLLRDEFRIAGVLPVRDPKRGWLAIPLDFPRAPDDAGAGATVLLELDGGPLVGQLLPAFTRAQREPGAEGGPILARLEDSDGGPLFNGPTDSARFRSGEHAPIIILGMRPDLATADLFAGMEPPRRWPPDMPSPLPSPLPSPSPLPFALHRQRPGGPATVRGGAPSGAARTGGRVIGFGAGPGMPGLVGPPPVFTHPNPRAAGLSAGPPDIATFSVLSGPSLGHAHRPEWHLALAYADGAVDDVVTSLRRRNLALGFSILALLGAAIAALSLAVRRAHALAERQRQFMASMSHELRTPLAVIGAAAENLRDGTVEENLRVREYGTMIHGESRRLGAMLDHALRLAAGRDLREELRLQPLDVRAVVDAAIESFAQELRTRGGQIDRTEGVGDDDAPPIVTADPEALRQAIENVVGNALKYGGDPPWVGVAFNRVETPTGPQIEISIEDRGMGIPPDEIGLVFEPFFRGREPLKRQIRGTGLGLALVARVMRAHGGAVSVDSRPGRGSVFLLRLPCAPDEPGRSA